MLQQQNKISNQPKKTVFNQSSEELHEQILKKVIEIEPAAKQEVLVSIPDLRRALDLPKDLFDKAIIDLEQKEKIFLHRHVYPARMTDEEREQMVTDGNSKYYLGIVLREFI